MAIFSGIFFIIYQACILAFDTAHPVLLQELLGITCVIGICFLFFRQRQFRTAGEFIFYFASLLILLHSFLNGMLYLTDTPVPRLRLYIKVIWYVALIVTHYLIIKKSPREVVLLIVVAFSSNFFLSWYYLGITLRGLPLLVYLIHGYFYVVEKRKERASLDTIDLLLGAFWVTALLSTALSANKADGVFGFTHLSIGVVLFFIARQIHDKRERRRLVVALVLLFGLILAFLLVLMAVLWFGGKLPDPGSNKIAGYHINAIGGYIAIFFPLPVIGALAGKNWREQAVAMGLIAIAIPILLITSSRSSILAVALTTIVAILLLQRSSAIRLPDWRMLIPMLILPLLIILLVALKSDIGLLLNDATSLVTLSIRSSIWKMYIQRTIHHALFFGFGPEAQAVHAALPLYYLDPTTIANMRLILQNYRTIYHSHNLLIQIFFSFGLVGLTLFLAFASVPAYRFLRLFKRGEHGSLDALSLGLALCVVSLFLQEQFDYIMANPEFYYPAMIFLGLLLHRRAEPIEVAPDIPPRRRAASLLLPIGVVLLQSVVVLVTYNFIINSQQLALFRESLIFDPIYGNIRFQGRTVFDPRRINRFEKWQSLRLPNVYDSRQEQFEGEFYLELFKKKGARTLATATGHYLRCSELNTYAPLCLKRVAEIYRYDGKEAEAARFSELYRQRDPFHFIEH